MLLQHSASSWNLTGTCTISWWSVAPCRLERWLGHAPSAGGVLHCAILNTDWDMYHQLVECWTVPSWTLTGLSGGWVFTLINCPGWQDIKSQVTYWWSVIIVRRCVRVEVAVLGCPSWRAFWFQWTCKAILNHASALVSACPSYVNRHPRTLSNTTYLPDGVCFSLSSPFCWWECFAC